MRIALMALITFIAFLAGAIVGWRLRYEGAQWEFNRAAVHGSIGRMEELVSNGVDPRARPFNGALYGFTPLTVAAEAGQLRSVEFLINHGVDVNQIEATETALDMAMHAKRRAERTIELLEKHGARTYDELTRNMADAPNPKDGG